MTNGEKIQTILDIDKDCTEVYGKNGIMTFSVPQDWWNAEYKEPITKNDLGVDAVSRQAVLDLIADYDLSMGQVVRGIHALPSVTPQEPFINKPCVSSGVCEHDKNKVLDKLRAEIEPTRKMYLDMNDIDWINGCDYVLSVIDKYKGESEE